MTTKKLHIKHRIITATEVEAVHETIAIVNTSIVLRFPTKPLRDEFLGLMLTKNVKTIRLNRVEIDYEAA